MIWFTLISKTKGVFVDKAMKAAIKTSFITVIVFFAALRMGPYFFNLPNPIDVAESIVKASLFFHLVS